LSCRRFLRPHVGGCHVTDVRRDLAPKIGREAIARGLLVRPRAGSMDPPFGDTICLSPPLSTPTEILDKIPQILRESIIAATK